MKKSILFLMSIFSFVTFPLFADDTVNKVIELDGFNISLLIIGFTIITIGMISSAYALSISITAYAATEKEHKVASFIPAIMPASQGIYSFAISFIMLQNMMISPFKVLLAGIVCGLPCTFSAIFQAKTAAACIKSLNDSKMDAGQALVATAVPELYALTGLACAFLAMTL